jgi:hypothetical protein
MGKVILAFDPALYKIAVAGICSSSKEVLFTFRLKLPGLEKRRTGPSPLWVKEYFNLGVEAANIIKEYGFNLNEACAVVEDSPRGSRGFRTAQALVASRVVLEAALSSAGVVLLDRISPDAWFYSVVVEKSIGRVASKERKVMARMWVSSLSQGSELVKLSEDEIDAIGIGYGAMRR